MHVSSGHYYDYVINTPFRYTRSPLCLNLNDFAITFRLCHLLAFGMLCNSNNKKEERWNFEPCYDTLLWEKRFYLRCQTPFQLMP